MESFKYGTFEHLTSPRVKPSFISVAKKLKRENFLKMNQNLKYKKMQENNIEDIYD